MNSVILNMPFSECPKWFKKRVIRIIFKGIRQEGKDPLKAKFFFNHTESPSDPFGEMATIEWRW